MNRLTDRESYDIQKVLEDKDYFPTLSERHRTAAVSLVAVFASANNMEYVPDAVINRDICRMALQSKDADCTILPLIPYPDIQKEGIQKFSSSDSAFVVHSFVDISDTQMAYDAVKADAYCLQLVPDKLLTKELCCLALQSPNMDEKMSKFVMERFPEIKTEKLIKDEKVETKGAKLKF
ncbi:MAG: hypothetical protein FWD60_07085 [Candidatus Azobacteroides sp.]|nr:hypothetical protein [Candidatus Azobacteroides sp.]